MKLAKELIAEHYANFWCRTEEFYWEELFDSILNNNQALESWEQEQILNEPQ